MATPDELITQISSSFGNLKDAFSAVSDVMLTSITALEEIDASLAALAAALETPPDPPPPPPPPPPAPANPFAWQGSTRHERVPQFNLSGAVSLNPSMDGVSEVERYPADQCFILEPGEYRWQDVRWKARQHFLSREGPTRTIFNGAGLSYAFRAKTPDANGAAIGGITLRDYGLGRTDNALFGAISPRIADTLFRTPSTSDDWYGGQATGTVAYDCVFERNGTNGYSLGNRGAAIRCKASGHFKTGIGTDRTTGGLIDSCELTGNALNPATGQFSDGGDLKSTWLNGGKGLSDVEPAQFTPAVEEFVLRNTIFRAKDPVTGKGSPIGAWFDLDGHQIRVSGCQFLGYEWTGLVFELCTNVIAEDNLFKDCRGYGAAVGEDFVLGALTIRETCWAIARRNRFENCNVAFIAGMSNRTIDMLRAPQRKYDVNYAWRGAPFPGDVLRPWIDPAVTSVNPISAMSNLASGEVEFAENNVDRGRIVLHGGSIRNGVDPQAAMRGLLNTYRFRGNTYGSAVRFEELNSGQLTLDQWRALGRTTGRLRDQ